jgi:diacylglycerol kinase (ATP)
LASPDDIFVVVNPASGKGRGARLVEPVLRALREATGAAIAHAVTTRGGDEVAVAQQALSQGYRRLVAVGGDGTWSNVGNAILRSGVDASLGLVAGGTGCDLAKSLDVPAQDVAAAARVVADGRTRTIDVGTVEGRYFLNIVGFGFDIAVIEDTWKVNYLRGAPLYLYCAVRQLYRFPGFPVELAVDGQPGTREELLMLVIANARVFGGGFKVAPRADLGDGQLDLVAFSNMPRRRRFPLMVSLLRGTHESSPEVRTRRAEKFRLRFAGPPTYERDGEWTRAASSELEVGTRRAALRVLVPAGALEVAPASAPAPAPA